MRVVSISVNGLEQAVGKGFFDWIAGQDADVICVQDHRMRAYEVEDRQLVPEGYEAYFIDGENTRWRCWNFIPRSLSQSHYVWLC